MSAQHPGERAAVLGVVDRLRRGAQHRHAGVLEPLRQAERRLPAERADDPGDRPGGPLGLDDLEHVLEGERLEVQPVGGVVVGGDGLGVAVDHHRLVAGVLQRHDRVHAGVVELDALPDPVGPGAEDQHRRLLPRLHLGLLVVGGVVVRRAGGELGRAGVDGLVDRPDARAASAASGRRPHRPARAAARRSAGRTGRAAWPGAAAPGSGTARRGPASPTSRDQRDLVDEPRVEAAGLGDLLDGRAGGQRLLGDVEPAVDRGPQLLQQLLGRPVVGAGPVQKPATFVSVDRIALPSASVKLRPIDMTSPTLFIVVVSRGSAPGNFSKANRGILTTT